MNGKVEELDDFEFRMFEFGFVRILLFAESEFFTD
ncbi:MAG: hypothetical protein JWR09_4617 [Mucilaginibacter sp.]|nr:hypothetical protein [Mucilaginibacter sp.]